MIYKDFEDIYERIDLVKEGLEGIASCEVCFEMMCQVMLSFMDDIKEFINEIENERS